MADTEFEGHYYYYGGTSLTPQARLLGWEIPVYVSTTVWRECCVAKDIPSRHNQILDTRIVKLLTAAYEGLMARMSVDEDFVFFPFKLWYWQRGRPDAKKQARITLGARLLVHPELEQPWLYIFDPKTDNGSELRAKEEE